MEYTYSEVTFKSSVEGQNLFTRIYEPNGVITGILQIVHGMAEHGANYMELGEYLAKKGYYVIIPDHLGHGKSVSSGDDYGYFFEGGINNIIVDTKKIHDEVKSSHQGIPYFLMGHSMGSFIVREYIARYGSDLSGAIVMGTSAGLKPQTWIVEKLLLKALIAKKGPKGKSEKIGKMATEAYNKTVPNPKTKNDWVSTDEKEVDKYTKDPMCGFTMTVSAYYSMGELLQNINKLSWYNRVPKDLPILLMSGEKDPVGDLGAGVRKVEAGLKNSGHTDVDIILYPDVRHALVNEVNKDRVFADIVSFMEYEITKAKSVS
jgi:alpha-beta hydrolase superfamily lysophospholipase